MHLSARLLAEHRGGQILALAPSAVGRTFALASTLAPPSPARAVEGVTVGVLTIRGPLAQRAEVGLCAALDGYDALTERFAALMKDPQIGAVVIVVDSPGGDFAGADAAAERLAKLKTKPVFAYVDESAGSAAYWIVAAAADAICLPPTGEVGSIGVMGVHVSEAGALEHEGLAVTLVSSPPGKIAGHSSAALDDLGRSRIEARVAFAANVFIGAIAKARGLRVAEVVALDGAMLTGQAAVDAGLADEVASLETVFAMAAEEAISAAQRSATPAPAAIPSTTNARAPFASVASSTRELDAEAARHGVSSSALAEARLAVAAAVRPASRPSMPEAAPRAAAVVVTEADVAIATAKGIAPEKWAAARAEIEAMIDGDRARRGLAPLARTASPGLAPVDVSPNDLAEATRIRVDPKNYAAARAATERAIARTSRRST